MSIRNWEDGGDGSVYLLSPVRSEASSVSSMGGRSVGRSRASPANSAGRSPASSVGRSPASSVGSRSRSFRRSFLLSPYPGIQLPGTISEEEESPRYCVISRDPSEQSSPVGGVGIFDELDDSSETEEPNLDNLKDTCLDIAVWHAGIWASVAGPVIAPERDVTSNSLVGDGPVIAPEPDVTSDSLVGEFISNMTVAETYVENIACETGIADVAAEISSNVAPFVDRFAMFASNLDYTPSEVSSDSFDEVIPEESNVCIPFVFAPVKQFSWVARRVSIPEEPLPSRIPSFATSDQETCDIEVNSLPPTYKTSKNTQKIEEQRYRLSKLNRA